MGIKEEGHSNRNRNHRGNRKTAGSALPLPAQVHAGFNGVRAHFHGHEWQLSPVGAMAHQSPQLCVTPGKTRGFDRADHQLGEVDHPIDGAVGWAICREVAGSGKPAATQ